MCLLHHKDPECISPVQWFQFEVGVAVIVMSSFNYWHLTASNVFFSGLVEVIPWSLSTYVNVSRGWLPEHGPGELHYFGQIPALNDCLYRYMYQSRYVALHDIDELILPQQVIRYVCVFSWFIMKMENMCSDILKHVLQTYMEIQNIRQNKNSLYD